MNESGEWRKKYVGEAVTSPVEADLSAKRTWHAPCVYLCRMGGGATEVAPTCRRRGSVFEKP